jgi:hypothetical protein
VDITDYVYGNDPIVFVDTTVLPSRLQDTMSSCEGNCKFIAADFARETFDQKSTVPYVIDTLQSTSEDKAVLVRSGTNDPITFKTPPGFSLDDYSIVGTKISSVSGDQDSCSIACRNNSGCVGFNISASGTACDLYSSIDSEQYDDSKMSFRKYYIDTNPTIDPPGTNLGDQGSFCANMYACNSDLEAVFNESTITSFSTADLQTCQYCPIRKFDRNPMRVVNELGFSYPGGLDRLLYKTGTPPLHILLTEGDTYYATPYLDGGSSKYRMSSTFTYFFNEYDIKPCDYVDNGFFIQTKNNSRYKTTSDLEIYYLPEKYSMDYHKTVYILRHM